MNLKIPSCVDFSGFFSFFVRIKTSFFIPFSMKLLKSPRTCSQECKKGRARGFLQGFTEKKQEGGHTGTLCSEEVQVSPWHLTMTSKALLFATCSLFLCVSVCAIPWKGVCFCKSYMLKGKRKSSCQEEARLWELQCGRPPEWLGGQRQHALTETQLAGFVRTARVPPPTQAASPCALAGT